MSMAEKEETILVGNIGIDAGLCWIGDPCYVLPDDAWERDQVKDWSKFCSELGEDSPTAKSFNYKLGHEGLGVCVSTGCGDGVYPVYATISDLPDWGKRIKSVTIVFIEDDEGEEVEE